MKILIVEDDSKVAGMIERGLAAEGYSCTVAPDVASALTTARADFDAIILDRMLPGGDGLEVCRRLRARGDRTPVLMLTALADVDERVDGLRAGADDYLGKPFDFEELLARVDALIRRATPQADSQQLQVGVLVVDLDQHTVRYDDHDIAMTALEFDLLKLLARHPDRFFSRERILSRVWPVSSEPETNVVDVYISRLRKKLDKVGMRDAIETRRGVGYRLRQPSRA